MAPTDSGDSRDGSGTRAVGYIRVSSTEQATEGLSLPFQRRKIEEYCASKGYSLGRIFADEGVSAASEEIEKRPEFAACLKFVRDGHADTMVVHKIDRFARHTRVFLNAAFEIGHRLEAIDDAVDFTSASGGLMTLIKANIAEYYSRNLSEEVKKGKSERKRMGLRSGRLPFGLKKQEGDDRGRLSPIPDLDTVVTVDGTDWSRWSALVWMFERAAEGVGLRQIAAMLHALGFPMNRSAIALLLRNQYFIGKIPSSSSWQREWIDGAHDALIDPDLFFRAGRAMGQNRRGGGCVGSKRRVHAITGLLRCARCGSRMVPLLRTGSKGDYRLVICSKYNNGDPRCDDRHSYRMEAIENQLVAYLDFIFPALAKGIMDAYSPPRKDDTLGAQMKLLRQHRENTKKLFLWAHVTEGEYLERVADIDAQERVLNEKQRTQELIQRGVSHRQVMIDAICNLSRTYWQGDEKQRNQLLASVIVQAEVDRGSVVNITFQPEYDILMKIAASSVTPGQDTSDRWTGVTRLGMAWSVPSHIAACH